MTRSLFLMAAMTLTFSSCGGNNQNSNASNINNPVQKQEFGLQKLNSTSPGEVFSSRLKGPSGGSTFTGDIKITNTSEEVINGVLVTPRVIEFKMYNGSGTGSSNLLPIEAWTITYYIESSTGNLVSFKQTYFASSNTLNCQSSSPYHMPPSIKSGDYDSTPGFSCGTQNLDGGSWKANSNSASQIDLSITTKTLDILGVIKDLEILYTLDATGNISAITIEGLSSYKDS